MDQATIGDLEWDKHWAVLSHVRSTDVHKEKPQACASLGLCTQRLSPVDPKGILLVDKDQLPSLSTLCSRDKHLED